VDDFSNEMVERFMKTRVYYADTDAGGVVYYANYLRWLEMARSDWLQQWGVSVADYVQQGVLFAVRRVEIDYRVPAVLGDEVEVTVEPTEVRRVRFALRQNVIRCGDNAQLASAVVHLACLTPEGKITTLPETMSETLRKMLSGQD
jgi:acyl-CoA thioester hydrolase